MISKIIVKFSKAATLSILIFYIQAIFTGCSSSNHSYSQKIKLTKEEQVWMEKFFNDLLFDGLNNTIIYTIFGSKPLSSTTLTIATKKEWVESQLAYAKNYSDKIKKEVKKSTEIFADQYDLPQNYEKWISWQKQYAKSSPILFVKHATENERVFNIYVLNVKEALWILHTYYQTFKEELGENFDPLEVINHFEDPESPFWHKIFANHYLSGLLYGYGKRNSFFFSCMMNKYPNFPGIPSTNCEGEKTKTSLEELAIPPFVSYEIGKDPIILKFQKERKRIQRNLKGKIILDEVLKQLGY